MKTILAAFYFALLYFWQDLCLLGQRRISLRDLSDGLTLLEFVRTKHWKEELDWIHGRQRSSRRLPVHWFLDCLVFEDGPLVHNGMVVHDYRHPKRFRGLNVS